MLFRALFGSVSIIALSLPAIAQEAPEEERQLDTIIVTGTKQNTTLQDTDVAVTVIGKEALEAARVSDIRRLDDLAPNVQFNDSGPLGAVYVSIRGVESNPFIVNRAAVYIDGIPFRELNNSVLGQLESVEVLRGPQSTLYGANTESGLIIINTRAPSDTPEFSATGTATTYDTGDAYQIDLFVGGPIIEDELAGSVTLKYSDRDAYIKNIGATPQGPGQIEDIFAQGRLRWTPTDQLTINATGYIIDTDAPGVYTSDGFPVDTGRYNAVYSDGILFDPSDPTSVPPANGDLRVSDFTFISDSPKYAKIAETVLGVGANYELGSGDLNASLSYRSEDIDDLGFEIDNTNAPILTGAVLDDKKLWNAELRFTSRQNQAFKYTAGISYYYEEDRESLGSLVGPGTLDDFNYSPEQSVTSRDLGIFGSLSYTPVSLPKLTGTIGLRYDQAERETNQQAGELDLGFAVFVFDALTLEDTFEAVLPRFALRYESTDDLTLYANIAKGALPGGFNVAAAQDGFQDDVVRYDQEELWSYEVGAKWRSADRRAFISGAVFFLKADNYQEITALIDDSGQIVSTSFIGSDAGIESIGLEIEGVYDITDNLSLTGNLGVVDSEYTEFAAVEADVVIGNPVKLIPEYDANLALRYHFDSGFFIRAEADLLGETALDEGNRTPLNQNAIDTQKAVERFNLQLGYEAEGWSARLFAENITDVRRISGSAFPTTIFPADGLLYSSIDAPRTVGVELSTRF